MRSRQKALLIAGLVVLAATWSCEKEPSRHGPGEQHAVATAQLPPGDRDQYGPLPVLVGEHRVTRGAAAGYVADQACAACHEDEFKSYQSVGMARSFSPPDLEKLAEPLDEVFVHDKTGYHYALRKRAGKLVLERWCIGPENRRFAVHSAEVAWIVGSGNHVRTYLSQSDRGELFQLPVSWYRGKGLAMSPGYDRVAHPRFERIIDRGCMFCHNAYPEVPVGSDLPHRTDLFPKKLPHGIGCQRCHGPGARHIELAEKDGASDEEIRARIVNPKNLDPKRSEEVCLACHLQPESVRSRMMPRSFTHPAYSYEPGKPLADFITYLDHGTQEERRERFEINHHAYRLRQSECYVESKGKLSCITCHNPHRKVAPEDRARHYRKACMRCHQPHDCKSENLDPTTADCVSCHMGQARPSDVVHVTMTDHRIARRKPADASAPRDEVFPEHHPLVVTPYFPGGETTPLYEVYAGFGRSYFPTEENTTAWRLAFEKTRPHTVSAYVNVGRGLLECGDLEGAVAVLSEASTKFPKDAATHWSLGEALLRGDTVTAAIASLERARDLDRESPGIAAALADAYWTAGARDRAMPTYARAVRLRPNNQQAWQSYGYALLQMRKFDAALHALDQAIALHPRDAYSYALKATIHRGLGRIDEMFATLERGALLNHDVKLDLAALLVLARDPRHRNPGRANGLVRAVTRAEPENGRAWLHQALVQHISGQDPSDSLARARQFGADPVSATAIALLTSKRKGDRAKTTSLLARLRRELLRPDPERLRPMLLAYLKAAGLDPR